MSKLTTQVLDLAGISYEIKTNKEKVFTCEAAAKERGLKLSQIVKCMLGCDPSGGIHVMLIPGDRVLKLKKVRQIAGGIRIELLSPQEISSELVIVVGAISPLQLIGRAEFYIDNSVFIEELVDISSGQPDAGIMLKPEDLKNVLDAKKCDIISTSR